jgi:hypothetical protein
LWAGRLTRFLVNMGSQMVSHEGPSSVDFGDIFH